MIKDFFIKFLNKFKAKKKIWLILPFFGFMLMLFIVPLIIVLVSSLSPVSSGDVHGTVSDNFGIIDDYVGLKIWKSLWISVVCTIICILIAFPFCYFLSITRNKVYKATIILFATAPIWSSFLIKLIGLKSLFDLIASASAHETIMNSTYGDIYTIIGICYIYIPFMILPLYSVLSSMPRNYVMASQDLGRNVFVSFFLIVIPYCKSAIISGLTLVLLPSFTTVAIPQFLNNKNDSTLIGDYIYSLGSNGLESNVAIAQASAISLFLGVLILAVYILWVGIPKLYRLIKRKISTGSFIDKASKSKQRFGSVKLRIPLSNTLEISKG